jgi:hypothetical protein
MTEAEIEAAARAACKTWFRIENPGEAVLFPWRNVARAALSAADVVRKSDGTIRSEALQEAAEIARVTLHAIISGDHPTWNEPVDDGCGGTVTATDSDVLDRTRSIVPAAITAEIAKRIDAEEV